MCDTDGGITVFEKSSISNKEYNRLDGMVGGIPLPNKDDVTTNQPYYYQATEVNIHQRNPEVVRRVTTVYRRSDGKASGRSVYYWRRGGDIPIGLFPDSSYLCPNYE